ncbi:hypothetical protein FRC16_007197 [Serendipita sp. 398]|nr:hypothetical protein FRC16_007197 [Serendipita sp. 398]
MASEQLSLKRRLITVAINYADLGFTSFGGPPVHFGILYDRFVKKLGWIDDKTYQELFAVSQALPGPASTKLAFAIALNYAGFLPSLLAFALCILIISACAGLCYTALWYFPVLMTAAGIAAVIYDLYLRRALFRFRMALRRTYLKLQKRQATSGQDVQRESVHEMTDQASHDSNSASQATEAEGARPPFTIRLVPGLTVIGLFFALFVTLMGLRAHFSKLVELRLFTNMVLAGTIIFGGGPVVIPLLREYIVQEGWVSSRDFLLGLAIIQSFPGPNFNCR